eukprot:TRINITY_DN19498_c0_g1_i1.p1 TRINITY_DN19498_c0_g1~~TRINITY_DN19498_c0_g1_i1.p1  ORF type:complete len:168 (-),score=17.17 TRINITY_DN19498_c0_g1_i1:126-587(-)
MVSALWCIYIGFLLRGASLLAASRPGMTLQSNVTDLHPEHEKKTRHKRKKGVDIFASMYDNHCCCPGESDKRLDKCYVFVASDCSPPPCGSGRTDMNLAVSGEFKTCQAHEPFISCDGKFFDWCVNLACLKIEQERLEHIAENKEKDRLGIPH